MSTPSSSARTDRYLLFDLGMVLCEPTGLNVNLADLLEVTTDDVDRVFWAERPAYDGGMTDEDYWRVTTDALGLGWSDEKLRERLPSLVKADIAGWATPRPDARAFLTELHERNTPVGILSNAPVSFAEAAVNFDWYRLADPWFFSGVMKTVKPGEEIYRRVEDTLGLPGEKIWFIDDRIANVEAAAARGWHAHLWHDDADTRRWLAEEGFLS
ncbi:MAG: HAD-IA family hydrolase [Propionibacteriaceae bacterium]|nr:HAD-IA family hydrolase [Propionibacteriaceae bacterium]